MNPSESCNIVKGVKREYNVLAYEIECKNLSTPTMGKLPIWKRKTLFLEAMLSII